MKWDVLDTFGLFNPFLQSINLVRRVSEKSGDIGKIASKIFNGLTGETSAQATMEANQRNIEMQNYWNEVAMQREDTAHQREVADLQAAGLNPWLSASGSGATTSAYNSAQVDAEDGSKILQATTAMALLALSRGLTAMTSAAAKTAPKTTTIYNYRR